MRLFIACLLSAASLLSGCYGVVRGRVEYRAHMEYAAPRELIIASAPPPVLHRIEARPATPMANAIWVAGHYEWRGHWQWIPGYWEASRPGYVWMAPVARRHGARIVYYGGYWRRQIDTAPAIYLQPGMLQLSARPSATVVTAPRPVFTPAPRTELHGGLVVRPAPLPPPHGAIVVRPAPRPVLIQPRPAPRPVVIQPRPPIVVRPPVVTQPRPAANLIVRPAAHDPITGRAGITLQHTATIRTDSAIAARPAATQVSVITNGRGTAAVIPAGQEGRAPVLSNGRGTAAEAPPGQLSCQLTLSRAPANGTIILGGTGFGASTAVMVGGNLVPITGRSGNELRARLLGSFGGGEVAVLDGARRARCGSLTIIGR